MLHVVAQKAVQAWYVKLLIVSSEEKAFLHEAKQFFRSSCLLPTSLFTTEVLYGHFLV
jgi:hypothetical protein